MLSMDDKAEKRYPADLFTDSINAAVAQWIEYWPPKPRVVGSIPASRAIFSDFRIISTTREYLYFLPQKYQKLIPFCIKSNTKH